MRPRAWYYPIVKLVFHRLNDAPSKDKNIGSVDTLELRTFRASREAFESFRVQDFSQDILSIDVGRGLKDPESMKGGQQ